MEVMEVQSAAGGADLLMFCDEEEQEKRDEEEEEERDEEEQDEEGDEEEQEEGGCDEALDAAEDEMESPVRTVPVHPVHSCSLKSSGAPLGFKLNGLQLTPGGAAELKLSAHPRGSASGFMRVQLLEPAVRTSTCTVEPDPDPTPIITGVVSGEAAQKVLSVFQSSPLSSSPWTLTLTSPWTRVSPQTPEPPRAPSGDRPPLKLQLKGQLGPVSPPDCLVCRSQYRLVTELRGFMCLCSSAIAQSLKNLKKNLKKSLKKKKKKKKPSRRSRDQKRSSGDPETSRTVPGPSARTRGPPEDHLSDRLSDQVPSPDPSCTGSPEPDRAEPLHGKLVIMVHDFYYGRDAEPSERPALLDRRFTGPYRCIHCDESLQNNVQLMSHMKEHVSQEDGDFLDTQCPHCFRHFLSPFKLQCHIEAVHSQYQSTAKCKICELEFVNEAAFLLHMKITHKPGEMPYACQVCNFRSSFYSDVWSHFQQFHSDSKNLLCQYCLRVMRSNTCYQQHFTRHQKKHVFACEKCRLQFLCTRERLEHEVNHRTHIRPPQLIGLRPGTKVTVRTYSEVGAREAEDDLKPVVQVKPPRQEVKPPRQEVKPPRQEVKPPRQEVKPPRQEAPKRKPVRSLGPLLSAISQESVSHPPQRCVECLSSFQDFGTHFPSLVHCSLCRFLTCCSTSYANHMINNHAACRKNSQYFTMFRSGSRLPQSLRCVSCTFTTFGGDKMADHLTERPDHQCIMMTHNELGVDGENQQPSLSVTSPAGHVGGAFIPIHLLPCGQTGLLLSVKHLSSPPPLSSPPAMTIKFLGPRPPPGQVSALSAPQLLVVLSSLCHGLPQACRRFLVTRLTVRSWIRQQERRLPDRKWGWRTEKLAEWVLSQHEQQLRLSEAVLLQTARSAVGEPAPLLDCYSWTVDFLLRHQLGLQPDRRRGRLPKSIRDGSRSFARSLVREIQSRGVPAHRVGSMDEFSIFIDPDRFSKQNPAALQLSGSPDDRPVFDVVLSALSDGTFLPPLLFFRGAAARRPEGFPDNVLLEARPEGFSDQERLQVWINQVWRPRVVSRCPSETVLLLDVYRGHLTEDFKSSLTALSTGAAFIPPGCCCRLQPLHVCVTPVLRDFLQARWTQLVSEGGLEDLGLDQLALTLACWLSEVSSTLNSETQTHLLRRSFTSVCDMQREDRGEEDRGEEGRGEEERMVAALTKALVQLPDASNPEPQMELLLVMGEKEVKEEDDPEEEEEVEEDEHPEEEVEEDEHPEEEVEEDEHPEEVEEEEEEEEEEHPEEL